MKISKRSKITSSKETADRKTDRRIFPTNVRYKGYMIRLDRGGDGYNVYDKHGELEDAGYASIEKAKEFVDELVAETKGHVVEASVNERQKEIDNKIKEKIMSIKDLIADYAQSGEFYDSESGLQRFFSIPISRYADSHDYSRYEKQIRSVLPNARVYSNFDDYEIIVDVSRCYENVNSSTEVYSDNSDWTELESKSVLDSDGFYTDYTLYTNGSTFICMFGDKDIYEPDEAYADYETENEEEAYSWFDNYEGFADEDDLIFIDNRKSSIVNNDPSLDPGFDEYDVYSSSDIKASMGRYDDYFGQTAAATYGDLIADRLKGKSVSKRRDTANEPGGLIYEANKLGIDMWDLLEALEGMCNEGRAREINDSTYKILGASDLADEEDLPQADQEYDSAKTSINSNKLPAIYHMITLPEGSVGIDYGGGKFDNAVEALAEQGVTLYVYDPYNRSQQHNRAAIKALRANGGADFAINSNVLNVIKEPEARLNVLENIKKITKPGAPIYITVYEGSGKGNEGVTKSGYQLNRKTADYLDEIKEVFPDAKRKGKLIIATNSGSVNSSTDIDTTERWAQRKLKTNDKYCYCGNGGRSWVSKDSDKIDIWPTKEEAIEDGKKNYKRTFKYGKNWDVVKLDDEPVNSSVDIKSSSEIIWDDLDWNQQIQVMKRYIRNYKGTRIFEDFADYINKPVEDIIDSFSDAESYGDIKIPERKQLDSEYRNDDIYSSITSSSRYWYFTRHGVQPGSVPKYVNILDIVDKPEGSYFLADGVILTNDLRDYDIKERKPEDSVTSSTRIEYSDILEEIREQCNTKLIHIMAQYGFDESEAKQYSRVDASIEDNQYGRIEIGCELDYDGLMRVCQELDPIVQAYDPDSYFEPVDSGIAEAWVTLEKASIDSSSNIQAGAYDFPEPSLDPPEYPEPEEGEETVEVECDINQLEITVDEDGSWEYQRDDFLDEMLTAEDEITSEEYDVYIRDRSGLIEDFDSIVEPNIPGVPGTYLISCHVKMVYDVTGVEIVREYQGKDEDGDPIVDEDYYTDSADVEFNRNESYITNFYSEEI